MISSARYIANGNRAVGESKDIILLILGMIAILQNMVVYALKAIFGHTEPKIEEQKPVASSYNLRERKSVNYKEVEEDE